MSLSQKPSNNEPKRSGFTLIELLVVVLIIVILLGIAIPLYLSSVKNSSIESTKSNLKIIAKAAQSYKVRQGTYPATLAVLITGGDLEQSPDGPRGVTYSLTGTVSACTISAIENGSDAFYDGLTNTTGTFDLQSGQFTNIDVP